MIVDDDREVVGERAVTAANHEIVDHALDRASQAIVDRDARVAGAHAQRGRAAGFCAPRSLGARQLAAGARVGAVFALAVRGGRRLADLGARAPALIDESLALKLRERSVVERPALGLALGRPVPVDSDRFEVGELFGDESLPDPARVEILDSNPEERAATAREQPREQRRPQVAEVQRAGGARGEAPVGAARRRAGETQ